MGKISYSYKLKSHPEKTLKEHLENVLNIILDEIDHKQLNLDLSCHELRELAKVVALSHDFGKATTFFQEYLHQKRNKTDKTNHSDISAFFAFLLAKHMNINPDFIPYLIVKRHHGNLNDLEHEKSEDYCRLFSEKINELDFEELKVIFNELWPVVDIENVLISLKNKIVDDDFYDQIYESADVITNKPDNYFIINFLFSLLIDSDKLDAALGKAEIIQNLKTKIRQLSLPDAVDVYKSNPGFIKEQAINEIREQIYNNAYKYLNHINLEKKIYSLNVPTGTGKTLTSLNFALKLKEMLRLKKNFNPKIIYCLPFTSIIDQNYSVAEDVIKSNHIDPDNHIILKHHHLSDLNFKSDDETFDIDKSLLLTESWMSSIVITTFAQFFSSFISNRNRSLKKFHNMANAIVILDEIQSVPYKYWTLINQTFKRFAEKYNTYFILVTATMPMIFTAEEIEEIIPEKNVYFQSKHLNRIKLISEIEKQYLPDFIEDLTSDIKINIPDKSVLAILNTISSSQEVFKHLHDHFDKTVLFLSTSVLPVERNEIIKQIKEKEERKILISTQVVEAGVDIDFDIVYRDIAPLDSVFQAAGRCNRHALNDKKGIVKVINLYDEKTDRQYGKYIYSDTQLQATLQLFEKQNCYYETDFLDLAEQYYKNIVVSQDTSYEFLKYINKLEYQQIGKFNLIDENLTAYDFYIELNEEASDLMSQFKDINGIENPINRKNAFLTIKKDFYKYVLSVRLKKDQKQYFEGNGQYEIIKDSLYCIPYRMKDEFYDSGGIGFHLNHLKELEEKGLIL
jgi:CRISPR-associated endonuclease/helicase Cas3